MKIETNKSVVDTLLASFFILLAIFALTMFVSKAANATDAGLFPTTNVNCTLPTERTNGDPFDFAVDGSHVSFYYGFTSGDYQHQVTRPLCQWVIDNTVFTSDTTLYIVGTVTDSEGRESGYSIETAHDITLAVTSPKPQTNLILEHLPAER